MQFDLKKWIINFVAWNKSFVVGSLGFSGSLRQNQNSLYNADLNASNE